MRAQLAQGRASVSPAAPRRAGRAWWAAPRPQTAGEGTGACVGVPGVTTCRARVYPCGVALLGRTAPGSRDDGDFDTGPSLAGQNAARKFGRDQKGWVAESFQASAGPSVLAWNPVNIFWTQRGTQVAGTALCPRPHSTRRSFPQFTSSKASGPVRSPFLSLSLSLLSQLLPHPSPHSLDPLSFNSRLPLYK